MILDGDGHFVMRGLLAAASELHSASELTIGAMASEIDGGCLAGPAVESVRTDFFGADTVSNVTYGYARDTDGCDEPTDVVTLLREGGIAVANRE